MKVKRKKLKDLERKQVVMTQDKILQEDLIQNHQNPF
jgi:hypothetical protein